MKSITNRISLFAATAVFLGTAAYGQTTMKADVPFGFAIPGGGATAGNYVVDLNTNGGGKVVRLYNVDTHKGVLAITTNLSGGPVQQTTPRLVFRCGAIGCAVSEIWTGDAGYKVPIGRARDYGYLASIPLVIEQARGN